MENPMHTREAAPARKPVKVLSALGTVVVFALLIVASRLGIGPLSRADADEKTAANAVDRASAFLQTLDAKQRERALLPFDSPKKSSWSNLPVTFVPRN